MKKIVYIIFLLFISCQAQVDPLDELIEKSGNTFDIWIKGGSLITGLSPTESLGDILVRGDTIAYVGKVSPEKVSAKEEIDATGRIVSPGFIDTHAHGDPKKTPNFSNFLAQGVTTITLGQDGSGPNPNTISQWMDEVDKLALGPNIVPFIGHGTLRILSKVNYNRKPDPDGLQKMGEILEKGLQAGAWGMSTGLEYIPGTYAPSYELAHLAEIVGKYDGIICSHMRSEDDGEIEAAIDELIEQGQYCKVQISHFKCVYGNGKARAEVLLDKLSAARKSGVQITADFYPYTASYTGIGILFPTWAKAPNPYRRVKKNRRTELETYIRDLVNKRNGPAATLIGTGKWAGKTLAQIADGLGKPFEDVLIDDIGPRGAGAAYFVMNEELQERILQDSLVMICSDGSPSMRHPRGYGSFARIIETFVLERESISLVDAIRKMTILSAQTYGLPKRGALQAGYYADIVIFKPSEVRARASFENPHQLASGFETVMVNGKVSWQANEKKGMNGRVLRKEN